LLVLLDFALLRRDIALGKMSMLPWGKQTPDDIWLFSSSTKKMDEP